MNLIPPILLLQAPLTLLLPFPKRLLLRTLGLTRLRHIHVKPQPPPFQYYRKQLL